jgi:hypothetical protein
MECNPIFVSTIKKKNIMTNSNETLRQAFENGTLVTFRTATSIETNVKIVKLNTDDVENKEFTFETSKGERYTRFSNDIWF